MDGDALALFQVTECKGNSTRSVTKEEARISKKLRDDEYEFPTVPPFDPEEAKASGFTPILAEHGSYTAVWKSGTDDDDEEEEEEDSGSEEEDSEEDKPPHRRRPSHRDRVRTRRERTLRSCNSRS
ncbi:unnamed protein product [Phytophthora fragariaefolia]|uniref:Unnamed protein product n=1 Tax=Phytophthora fragariaefolia TaxID=1490495 RepID=A0A9W7CU95_9STRA|nr:unnamed protein product [Phytophthora fragariaefolia]